MRLLLPMATIVLSGCAVSAAGQGQSGSTSWSFTINNGVSTAGGGLVLLVTYGDGSTSLISVPPGAAVSVPGGGSAVTVMGGGQSTVATPGASLWWGPAGWGTPPGGGG